MHYFSIFKALCAATHAFTLFENDDNDDWVTREPHNSSRTLISCHIDPESEFEITPTASVNCYLCSTVCRSFLARKYVYYYVGTYLYFRLQLYKFNSCVGNICRTIRATLNMYSAEDYHFFLTRLCYSVGQKWKKVQ